MRAVLAAAALVAGPVAAEELTCSAAAFADLPSAYYSIEMVSTKRVAGTGNASGIGRVTFSSSPFGVSVSDDGRYVHDVDLSINRIKKPKSGFLTAWVAKSDLSDVRRLGLLDEEFRATGRVGWNKFLLVVSLEPDDETSDSWRGPVVLRGMSRSGMMHTLAGHGPFEREPCSKWGFN